LSGAGHCIASQAESIPEMPDCMIEFWIVDSRVSCPSLGVDVDVDAGLAGWLLLRGVARCFCTSPNRDYRQCCSLTLRQLYT
jgi:hypothetical protein